MKKSTILILFLASINFVISQNLVPNGSFEEYYDCPEFQANLFTEYWFKVTNNGPNTPDYFNDCTPEDTQADVPDNIAGYQFPHDGEGYVGVFCYGSNSGYREYIEVQLESPLIAGQEYEFTMYVSLGDEVEVGVDNLGALFTDYEVIGDGDGETYIDADPQVKANVPIISKINWTPISGAFIAEGGEEYLTLGNFFTDEETEAIESFRGLLIDRSYYYIDSVSLTPSNLGIGDNSLENQFNIYPNPVSDVLNINNLKSVNYTVKIFSLQGQLLKTDTSSSDKINVGDLKSGIYFIEITSSEGFKKNQKFIKQ